jgi:hypothetical protein
MNKGKQSDMVKGKSQLSALLVEIRQLIFSFLLRPAACKEGGYRNGAWLTMFHCILLDIPKPPESSNVMVAQWVLLSAPECSATPVPKWEWLVRGP